MGEARPVTAVSEAFPFPAGVPATSEQRQAAILRRLATDGHVDVFAMAEDLGIPVPRLRRDLAQLQDHGLVRANGDRPPTRLNGHHPRQDPPGDWDQLARAAAGHVPAHGSMLIDAGPAAVPLSGLLPDDHGDVYTNSLTVAGALAVRGSQVWMLGGTIPPDGLAAVGQEAVDELASILVDVAFVVADTVSVELGLTAGDAPRARLKAAMLTAARHRVLIADRSAFTRTSTYRFGDLSDVDVLVTDAPPPADHAAALHRAGVTVQVVA